ncbi:MAG: hypothetical protein GEV06_05715 [Luteitalea sp.]|nr:hypothetical protein [Luteitalea sp.]
MSNRKLVVGVDLRVFSGPVVAEASHMFHQLPRRDRPPLFGEARQVVLHGGVEVDEALLMQQAHRGRGHGLGHAANAKARSWRDRYAPPEVRPPKRLGPRELTVDRHRDGHAGQVLIDDQIPREELDVLNRVGVSGGRRSEDFRRQRQRVVAGARDEIVATGGKYRRGCQCEQQAACRPADRCGCRHGSS